MFGIKLDDTTVIEMSKPDIIIYIFVMLISVIVFFSIDAKVFVSILFLVFTIIFISLNVKSIDKVD